MNKAQEIIEALRDECEDCREWGRIDGLCISKFCCAISQAADLIEQQAAEIEALRAEQERGKGLRISDLRRQQR